MASRKKYVFVQPSDKSFYTDTVDDVIKFYQICMFPNPKMGKYEIREFTITGKDEIVSRKKYEVSEDIQKKLLHTLRDNKYRLYSTVTLENIEFPSCQDIALARSGILNNDSDYAGYASFNAGKEVAWKGTNFVN